MYIETDVCLDLGTVLKEIMDTSNYPRTHPLHSLKTENKLGCFKDETSSKPIREICTLKPKMYYVYNEENKKTAKGVEKW